MNQHRLRYSFNQLGDKGACLYLRATIQRHLIGRRRKVNKNLDLIFTRNCTVLAGQLRLNGIRFCESAASELHVFTFACKNPEATLEWPSYTVASVEPIRHLRPSHGELRTSENFADRFGRSFGVPKGVVSP